MVKFSAIGIGANPNDGSGDTLRAGAVKIDSNFALAEAAINSAIAGIAPYNTKADLITGLAGKPNGTQGRVIADPDASLNGLYVQKDGGPVIDTAFYAQVSAELHSYVDGKVSEIEADQAAYKTMIDGIIAQADADQDAFKADVNAKVNRVRRLPSLCIGGNRKPIYDPDNHYGGGTESFYIPINSIFEIVSNFAIGEVGNAQNGGVTGSVECTEMAKYTKIRRDYPYNAGGIVFDGPTGTAFFKNFIEIAPYLLAEPKRAAIASWYGRAIDFALPFYLPPTKFGRNLFNGGKEMDPAKGTTPYADDHLVRRPITDAALIAKGFTYGWANATGASGGRVVVGGFYSSGSVRPEPGTRYFMRFYVESSVDMEVDADDPLWPDRCGLYFWKNNQTAYIGGPNDEKQGYLAKKLSPRAAMYECSAPFDSNDVTDSFYGGFYNYNAGYQSGVELSVTGMQIHVGIDECDNIRFDDYPASSTGGGTVPVESDFAARDAANLQRSAAMRTRIVSSVQTPTAAYNLLVLSGQSLGVGSETWPAISKAQPFNNKMVGTCTIPRNDNGQFDPFGDALFHPLIAAARRDDGDRLLTDGEVAALTPGNGASAESPNIGWANSAKFRLNQHLMVADDSRSYVSINGAIGGQGIVQFLHSSVDYDGSTLPDGPWHNRLIIGATKVKDAATALGGTSICAGKVWMQGEYDYQEQANGRNLYSAYKFRLGKWLDQSNADIITVFNQALPPANFVYQAGTEYTLNLDRDGNAGLAIGMAQLDLSLERNDLWMVGPTYQTTDKGGHLDSNGSRWYGEYIGKVHHRVVHLGQDWEPLRPIRIERIGNAIYLDFHVPDPPLVFDTPYRINDKINIASRGFVVTDADHSVGGGGLQIAAVTLIGQTQVRIDLVNPPSGDARVWYGVQQNYGYGMLRDSDPTVSYSKYEYLPGTGMYAAANIAERVNKPYPLWNWCVAFCYPVGFGV